MKEIYKYVEVECGDLYVITAGNTQEIRMLHVDNLDTLTTTVSLMPTKILFRFNYSSFEGHAYSRYSFFGGSQDTAPLVWDRVNCGGSETSLTQCSKYYYGYRRTCTQTAGIYCAGQILLLY